MIQTFVNEIKRCGQNKVILVVSVIIPLVVCLLLGWAFEQGAVQHIPMGIADQDNSALSRTVVQYFVDNDTFHVVRFENDAQQLETLMQSGDIKTAMVIPKNFEADVLKSTSPTVLMLYDGSSMSNTSAAKAKATEILTTVRIGATIKQLQGKMGMRYDQALNTAMPITFASKILYNPTKNFQYFLMPGICLAIVQVGLAMAAVVCINNAHDETIRRRYNKIGYVTGKIFFYTLLGSLVFIASLQLLVYVFQMPLRGSFADAMLLCTCLAFSVAAISCAVSAIVKDVYTSITIVGFAFIPDTIFSGYTWPTMAMPNVYQKLAAIIPYTHAADNVRHIFLSNADVAVAGDAQYMFMVGLGASVLCMVAVWLTSKHNGGGEPIDVSSLS